MARTNSVAVIAILLDNYDTSNAPSLSGFIDAASSIVDDIMTAIAAAGKTALSSTKQELIERWLTAHMYHCADPTYTSKSTGGASGSFMGSGAMGLDGSRYGQMAKMLDSSNTLLAIDKGGRVSAVWLGKPPSTQIPYRDRE